MSLLALFALASLDAQAFAPSDEVYIGIEPSRALQTHPARQTALRNAAPWQAFVNAEGQGWQVVFDEKAGTVRSAWGPGIDLGPMDSELQVEQALRALFRDHAELVGAPDRDLSLRSIAYLADTDTWYVDFDRNVGGIPIWRGGVEARIRQGKLVMLSFDTHPGATAVVSRGPGGASIELSAETALEESIALGPLPDAEHAIDGAALVVLPFDQGSGVGYRVCWETRTRTVEGPGIWVSLIDAETGELVNVYNEVRFFEGTVLAQHDLRTVDGNLSVSPVPLARVNSGEVQATTASDGSYSIDVAGPYTTDLNGSYLRVRNQDGDNGAGSFDGADFTWTTSSATLAEIDTYVFLHQIRSWGEVYAPGVGIVTDRLTSKVNLNQTCNAYYDGSVNFFEAGSSGNGYSCNNTGRIADVNYHEWGHGLHYTSLVAGVFDGSVSEGIGDITAFLQTGDPIIAPYFLTTGSGIRRVDTDRVYPTDVVGEVHEDGLIFAGAVWDLWDILEETYGAEYAFDTVSTLFAQGIRSGPTTAETYDAFALVDDDDGNLGNGTPHACELLEAFQRHGIGPGGSTGSLLYLGHVPMENQPPMAGDYAFSADIANLAPGCMDFTLSEAKVHWSTDDGDHWDSAPLAISGELITGAIPEQEPGSVVHYYISAEDRDGINMYSPSGGRINPHTFLVGELVQLYCEDFEGSTGGDYWHELVEGRNDVGADDWQLGTPIGEGGDPDFAYSGDQVWGNDLGEDNYNGEYQDDKHNRLNSAPIEVGDNATLFLQYRRWLGVQDGYYDRAIILVDGEEVWSNHGTSKAIGDEHHVDRQWALHTVPITDDGDGEVVISWDIVSDNGQAFGGWNIDDVCVYTLVANQGGPDDSGDPTGDGPGLDEPITLSAAGGCGCTSSTGGRAAGWIGALGLLALLRRRRSA